jgi:hypothetical protein
MSAEVEPVSCRHRLMCIDLPERIDRVNRAVQVTSLLFEPLHTD